MKWVVSMRLVKALVLSLPAVGMTLGGVSAVVGLNAVASAPVYAAEKPADKQVSAKVGKPLQEALQLVRAKDFKGAKAKLDEAREASKKSAFDEYKINEIASYVAFNMGDPNTAVKALDSMLDSPEASAADRQRILDQLSKFEYQSKDYTNAIKYGSRYLKDVGPNIDIALLVAQAYYLQKDYPQAINATQSLIRMANQAGQTEKKEWLDLLRSAQQLAGKDDDANATLSVLLTKYPSPEYWRDTFIIEQNKGRGSDRKNMELLRLKMVTGVLKDSDYMEMAQLGFALGFPGDAKMILEKGFANKVLGTGNDKDRENRLLAKAQTDSAADQKSLAAFEKEANAASNGEADIKLGFAYETYGDYQKAIDVMKRGLKKGNLKAEDEAHFLLGVTYFNAKKTSDAIAQFKAVPADSKLASLARLWIIYANSKG
ncbi:MAG TPA: tetratricopeptide repeat protein [Spongiibacteraceae bacterium]|nr:tetratricopeptide repeat protein [Spongiibacteraceae bacterium]